MGAGSQPYSLYELLGGTLHGFHYYTLNPVPSPKGGSLLGVLFEQNVFVFILITDIQYDHVLCFPVFISREL